MLGVDTIVAGRANVTDFATIGYLEYRSPTSSFTKTGSDPQEHGLA